MDGQKEYKYDFPFGILDVASLIGLNTKSQRSDGVYTNCPICGDTRGKVFLNTKKDVYRCYHCGEYGGMLSLYANVHNIDRSKAYREISELLHTGAQSPESVIKTAAREKLPQVENSPIAAQIDVHNTLTQMLGLLTLTEHHRKKLRERGLSDDQIDMLGYRSAPNPYTCRSLTERLIGQGLTVQGVPGFYQMKNNWTLNFGEWSHGILIPYRGIDGLIGGLQIRLDAPLRDRHDSNDKKGTKYLWFSSASKHMGVSPGCPVHFIGEPNAKTVYVTEGAMKADIAHCLSGRTFGSTAGANNVSKLERLFAVLAKNGTKLIIEAEDMDKYSNKSVADGAARVHAIASNCGISCHSLTWKDYKGVDDWLFARKTQQERAMASV